MTTYTTTSLFYLIHKDYPQDVSMSKIYFSFYIYLYWIWSSSIIISSFSWSWQQKQVGYRQPKIQINRIKGWCITWNENIYWYLLKQRSAVAIMMIPTIIVTLYIYLFSSEIANPHKAPAAFSLSTREPFEQDCARETYITNMRIYPHHNITWCSDSDLFLPPQKSCFKH